MREKALKNVKRVVVKVGSAVVTGVKGSVRGKKSDCERVDIFSSLSSQISSLMKEGKECVLVSSGAIAMGMEKLSMTERPSTIPERQAVAAVGQSRLMARYDEAFSKAGVNVAQILLTHDDLGDRKRFLNARNTINTLLTKGILPIINENDSVSVEEIKFGDNDKLAALATNVVEADLLVILSDVESVFDKDPKVHEGAKRISEIADIDSFDSGAVASSTSSLSGTGGIGSKLAAAKIAAHSGTATIITSGFIDNSLCSAVQGNDVGTFIGVKEDAMTSKQHWITYSTRPTGKVVVDEGAKKALLTNGKSLLPSGVVSVAGAFDSGDVIHCVDLNGMEFARGVVNYSFVEIEKIKGLKTTEIEKALGYKVSDEVIHRDDLVVL